jgi:membrane protein DedA with SNARE-associated domain
VEHVVTQAIGVLSAVPSPFVYVIAAMWMGLESAGIGVPIEAMMLFVGSLAAEGSVNLALAILCAGLGCVAFSGLAYLIGRRAGTTAIARVGRFVGLNQKRADHIELWLRHRGLLGVVLARLTPMVRSFGSYVMGAAGIPPTTFLLGTLIGSLAYCGVFLTLGSVLGANYRKPLEYLDAFGPRGLAIVAVAVVTLIALHHVAGRFSLHRMARHFHLHHAQHAPATTRATRG